MADGPKHADELDRTAHVVVATKPRWLAQIVRGAARWWRDDEAVTSVEYAVMLAVILISVIVAIGTVGAQTGGMWGGIENDLRDVGFFGPSGS